MCAAFNSSFYRLTSKEYLAAAVENLQNNTDGIPVDSIKGIWVASNDPSVLNKVRAIAVTYFPNVRGDTITMVSSGIPRGPHMDVVRTHTSRQVWQDNRVAHSFIILSL